MGGSAPWAVAEKQAKQREYLVCVRNAKDADFANSEPHGTAFMVGKISGLRQAGLDKKGQPRFLIEINAYARVDYPKRWGKWRNPVKYTTLEELGIDSAKLKFQAAPAPTLALSAPSDISDDVRPLTIAQAKQGLALRFGVDPAAIEILIKG